jgi:hypothetical protein
MLSSSPLFPTSTKTKNFKKTEKHSEVKPETSLKTTTDHE